MIEIREIMEEDLAAERKYVNKSIQYNALSENKTIEELWNLKPEEFLELIEVAKCVYAKTDSECGH